MKKGRPSRPPGLIYEELPEENELMLVDEEKGKVRVLNAEAAGIWLLCNGKRSEAEIVSFLKEMFPSMKTEEIDRLVGETLLMLADQGFIER
jgi:hypothetical protein